MTYVTKRSMPSHYLCNVNLGNNGLIHVFKSVAPRCVFTPNIVQLKVRFRVFPKKTICNYVVKFNIIYCNTLATSTHVYFN